MDAGISSQRAILHTHRRENLKSYMFHKIHIFRFPKHVILSSLIPTYITVDDLS
jgi:hypothetical protein